MAYKYSPRRQPSQREPAPNKNGQSSVTCGYQAQIGGYWRNVTILWNKNLMSNSLTISVDTSESNRHQTCKIDIKPWHFWAKRGYKSFEVDGIYIETYWDLRSAKFTGSPEPCTDYYVALVSDEEVVLLLGDYSKKAYKRIKARPAMIDAILVYKKEHVYGKKSFLTRAKLDNKNREHDIIVESSTSGPRDPEMWISIDGIILINIKNLQWKFRGNETVLINQQPVQVYWDVYAWLFCDPGSNYGLFIFKPGGQDPDCGKDDKSSTHSGVLGEGSDCSGESKYYSTLGYSRAPQYCLLLYAWKIE